MSKNIVMTVYMKNNFKHGFWASNQNLAKTRCSTLNYNVWNQNTILDMSHSAAVTQANLWPKWIIRIKQSAKVIFIGFALWAYQLFVKCIPGSTDHKPCLCWCQQHLRLYITILLMTHLMAQPQHQAHRQNKQHFVDELSKCIFLTANLCSLVQISCNVIAKDPVGNKA